MRVLVVVLILGGGLSYGSSAEERPLAPAADYLPLEVGNSWTFSHEIHDEGVGILEEWKSFFSEDGVTISVETTEVFEGNTYYVISDMPEAGPPAPPYFIAGRKLRWDGIYLTELTDEGREVPLYPFLGAEESDAWRDHYGRVHRNINVPTTPEGDFWVIIDFRPADIALPLGRHRVRFSGYRHGELESWDGWRVGTFVEGYGVASWTWGLNAESGSHPEFLNHLGAVRARIGGVPILYEDIRVSADVLTSAAVVSWGLLKNLRSALQGE